VDEPLIIEVDRTRSEPAYEQVARQIRDAIATGALRPDTALPGVRTLASDLGVNLNTIARAYRQLEDGGFVRIHDRSGVQVAGPARMGRVATGANLREELWQVLVRLRQSGASAATIRAEVERHLARLFGSGQGSED
jgi:DNA-binding transcriptional regulator YhcF (GntR family)